MEFIDKIFFYGQLKSDGLFFPLFKKYVLDIKRGYTFGTLYEYRMRPVYIDIGKNKVFGEIFTVFNTTKVFSMLDNIEYYLFRTLTYVYDYESDLKIKSYIYTIKDIDEKELIPIETGIWINK